jgi:hypothetical protein
VLAGLLITAPQFGSGQTKTDLQALHQYLPFFSSLQTGHFSMIKALLQKGARMPAANDIG